MVELRNARNPGLFSTPYQKVDAAALTHRELTMREVLEGSVREKILVISHRWVGNGQPDPGGLQEREIIRYLNSPQGADIELVWHDVRSVGDANAGRHSLA